jgi:hypothetical protein
MKLPLHLLLLTPVTPLLLPHIQHHTTRRTTSLRYKPSDEDTFNVLANTERWIAQTLQKSNDSAKKMHYADDKTPDNPYARKEVMYSCETGDEACGIVGGIFRRVREARELGERYGVDGDGEFCFDVFCWD